ncbi:MAG: hypothetical protein HQ553_02255 [Chloroflexi bacterium]|nr:hypothetical protein [Chloroflexota bacterium]
MPEKKKVAVVMAAVNAYLEEEAIVTAPMQRPTSTVSMWQSSGRQEIMQMSSLWQRRIVPLR